MPIMDGLAATKKIRALEAGSAEKQERTSQENQDSNGSTRGIDAEDHVRIPIVGLSADIQLATKEVTLWFWRIGYNRVYLPFNSWSLRRGGAYHSESLSLCTLLRNVSKLGWMST